VRLSEDLRKKFVKRSTFSPLYVIIIADYYYKVNRAIEEAF
jgi:hypothetical protein